MEILFDIPDQIFPVAGRQATHRFSHPAMATEFELWIKHEDAEYAGQAASDAFRLLDRLESELSRYDPGSDISRLNASTPGNSMVFGEGAFECLRRSFMIHEATQGAFDVTVGGLKDLWMQESTWWKRVTHRFGRSHLQAGMRHLHFREREWVVTRDAPVMVDLGAIGKGYAIDRLLERLADWDLSDVLAHGGASSVAARGHGWPVTIRHPLQRERILLQFDLENRAMGASGLAKGRHIIDPRRKKPAHGVLAAWVAAPDAATADAFSTAFMVMSADETRTCLASRPELRALVLYPSGESLSLANPLESKFG